MDITQQLTDAMQQHQRLRIEYTNKAQQTTILEITPRRSEGRLMVVFCHTYNKELSLNPEKIKLLNVVGDKPEEESQTFPTTIIGEPKTTELPSPPPITPLGESFANVTRSQQWIRLVRYYIKCLKLENAQSGIVNRNVALFFPLDENSSIAMLDSRLQISFSANNKNHKEYIRFIADRTHRDQQLFFGYPILTLPNNRIAPLFFTAVTVNEKEDDLQVQSEDMEINYAALSELGVPDEDCEAIIANTLAARQASDIETAILTLYEQVEQILDVPFQRNKQTTGIVVPDEPFVVYEGPCFFWSEVVFTRSLLEELNTLTQENRWDGVVPATLKQLFSSTPEHDYQEIESSTIDKSFYPFRANDHQRKAVRSARTEPITVVTGPPGTGKSQLILNIIADSVKRGERVLFASRNNEAVNIVINRLHSELAFYGAVRVGSRESFAPAANLMLQVLDEAAAKPQIDDKTQLERQYEKLREEVEQREAIILRINQAKNTQSELVQERKGRLGRLPDAMRSAFDAYPHRVRTKGERDALEVMLSPLLQSAEASVSEFEQLQSDVRDFFQDSSNPLLAELRKFEIEQGIKFGGGILHKVQFSSSDDLKEFLQTWFHIVSVLGLRIKQEQKKEKLRQIETEYNKQIKNLPDQVYPYASAILDQITDQNVELYRDEIEALSHQVEKAKSASKSLLHKIKNPTKSLVLQLNSVLTQFGISIILVDDQLAEVVYAFQLLFSLHRHHQLIRELKDDLTGIHAKLETVLTKLPELLRDDVQQVDLRVVENLNQTIDPLRQFAARQLTSSKGFTELFNSIEATLLTPNERYATLCAFKVETIDEDWWTISSYQTPKSLLEHLQAWLDVFSIWEINRRIERVEQEIGSLPDSRIISIELRKLRQEFIDTSRKLLHDIWFSRVLELNNYTLQGARSYAEATLGLTQPDLDTDTARTYTKQRAEHLRDAMEVFPIWATTNLSAKSNFKLDPAIFDLVVIDEASQCDIPSALPLIFRGKRIVIIGDPNQLTHITRLQKPAQVNARYGIDGGAFGYAEKSLFSLAQSSVGNHPGTILLNEHYRSDPRIIAFPNREFYAGRLSIHTDMEARELPTTLLEYGTGLFWIKVAGKVETLSARGRSRYNSAEINALQRLIPRVIQKIDSLVGSHLSFGIVTPFREQKNAISRWVEIQYPGNERIKVGTAHTFQGDERDVMFFSPVLAEGIGRTQSWLENTANLLNVALTRARNLLVVVGDWDYCHSLPTTSKYRRLADYTVQLGTVLNKEDDLPLLHL